MTDTAYSLISSTLSITKRLEQEQIIDIAIGRARKESTGNKHVDFLNITREWEVGDWKSVLKEYYNSYDKAKLPEVLLPEVQPGISTQIAISTTRDTAAYKKAPDPYYLYKACAAGYDSIEGAPTQRDAEVLIVVYACLIEGENYPTACFPPQAFLNRIQGFGMKSADFYETCLALMDKEESFEEMACRVGDANISQVKQVRKIYRELFRKDTSAKIQKARTAASKAAIAGGKVAKKVAKEVIAEEAETGTQVSAKRVAVDMASSGALELARTKIFVPYGIAMLIINGVATPTKFWVGTNLIKAMASDNAGLLKMFGVSVLNIFTCFLPLIGVICTLMMLFTGLIPGRSHKKRFAYLAMCLAIICTAYSILLLIKVGLSTLTAFITRTMTPENIARGVSSGVLGAAKGLFTGITSTVAGWFK